MAYEKRVCVLKQIKRGFSADGGALTGAVYCERLGTELTVTPRIMGIAPVKEGRYVIAVWADGKTFCFEQKGNVSVKIGDAPSVRNGFAALLCFVRGEAEPLAYGSCGNAPVSHEALLAAAKGETEEKKRKRVVYPLPPNELPAPTNPNVPLAPTVPVPDEEGEEEQPFRQGADYDDEAIAAVDYFRASEGDENADASRHGEEKEEPQENGGDPHEDGGACPPFLKTRGKLTYYNEIRERLEAALRKYPPDDRLKSIFPCSEWVNAGGSLLGVVYEEGQPRYLCVAVEAQGEIPEEMRERGIFVPLTQFSENEGFYVAFQDADTGDYVKISDG